MILGSYFGFNLFLTIYKNKPLIFRMKRRTNGLNLDKQLKTTKRSSMPNSTVNLMKEKTPAEKSLLLSD